MKQMKMKPLFGACWRSVSLMAPAQSAVLLSLCCGILVLILTAGTARAQDTPGVTDKEVTIGSASALQGPSQFFGAQTALGASTVVPVMQDEADVGRRRLMVVTAG